MRIERFFRSSLIWLAPLAFLGVFFFYPLTHILALGLNLSILDNIDPALLSFILGVLTFTFYQAVLSTLLTLLLGLALAYLFSHFDFPGKSFLRVLTAIPFMLPTVVVAAGFNALLGPHGWFNLLLMGILHRSTPPIAFVGTFSAILVAHIFYNTTIVVRMVGNAWATLDSRFGQASRVLGADSTRTLWHVTLPLLRPAILASSLLVFLFDFTSYGVILLLGGPHYATLEVEIYIQALQMLNLPVAALLSILQLLCTLAFSTLYSRYVSRVTAPVKPVGITPRWAKGISEKFIVSILILITVFYFAFPILALPLRSFSRLEADRAQSTPFQPGLTTQYYTELFINRQGSIFYVPPVDAAVNSLTYAGVTVLLSLLLGFPAAFALSRPGRFERLIDPFLMLPLGASAVTLGLGFIVTFNKPPLNLLSSRWLIPLAHTTIALPFVIRNLQSALATIPGRYREAAAVLGANPWHVWREVDWPIISRAVISAGAFAFTISLGEFGAASLLVRPDYPTLPTAIYRFLSLPGGLNYGQAMAMTSLLMLITGCGIFLIEKMRLPGAGEF